MEPAKHLELWLVFECKRVAPERKWIFFRHHDRQHRATRAVHSGLCTSDYFRPTPDQYWVCSEGFEWGFKSQGDSVVADQDPVFRAASQLATAFLGLVRAEVARGRRAEIARFAPILVTTAPLAIAKTDWQTAPLQTGKIEAGELELIPVDHLVLKQPAPTPEGIQEDFRERVSNDPWAQIHTESIYVVTATALASFLSAEKREFMAWI